MTKFDGLEQENNGKYKNQMLEKLLRGLEEKTLEKESGEGDDLEDALKMLEENNGKYKIQIPEELVQVLEEKTLEKESGEEDHLEDVLKMLEN